MSSCPPPRKQGIMILSSQTRGIPDLKINRLERLSLLCGILCQDPATTLPGKTYCCNAPTYVKIQSGISACQCVSSGGSIMLKGLLNVSSPRESFRPPSCIAVEMRAGSSTCVFLQDHEVLRLMLCVCEP